ncbi:MAG TPA: hypothetical protein GXX69_00525 [Firmicutes bacterium]|nr:hypothetical protein [Bacillota bacterium]
MLELQLTIIGWTLLCGIGLGFVFDSWCACRAILHPGRLATSLGDLVFWFLAAAIVAAVLLSANYGELRGWYLLSWALGFAIYQELISQYLQRPLKRFLTALFRFLLRMAVWLGLPVWLPLKFVIRQGKAGGRKGKKIVRTIGRLIKRKLAFLNRKKGP